MPIPLESLYLTKVIYNVTSNAQYRFASHADRRTGREMGIPISRLSVVKSGREFMVFARVAH